VWKWPQCRLEGVAALLGRPGARVKVSLLAIAVVACAACGPGDREVRLRRDESEHKALMVRLEELQARLLADQARVRYWTEMRERHASTSAIACSTLESHALAMAQRLRPDEPDAESARAPATRRARVASLRPVAATSRLSRR
jgi:hypothetical protein